jgi:hypothetical protein
VACWVFGAVGIFIEVAYLFLVDGDGQYFLLLEFVGMILVAFDDHESVIFVQFDLRRCQEDLGKEVLLLEKLFVVWLL